MVMDSIAGTIRTRVMSTNVIALDKNGPHLQSLFVGFKSFFAVCQFTKFLVVLTLRTTRSQTYDWINLNLAFYHTNVTHKYILLFENKI